MDRFRIIESTLKTYMINADTSLVKVVSNSDPTPYAEMHKRGAGDISKTLSFSMKCGQFYIWHISQKASSIKKASMYNIYITGALYDAE